MHYIQLRRQFHQNLRVDISSVWIHYRKSLPSQICQRRFYTPILAVQMLSVHTDQNQIVFIDWDGAGLGPAIMDLGYLLLNCHVGQPEWPVIIPDQKRIGDVLDGYCYHRTLTDGEIDALSAAIGFTKCHHNIKALPAVIPGDWQTNRELTRFHKRYEIVPEISKIATRIFRNEHSIG